MSPAEPVIRSRPVGMLRRLAAVVYDLLLLAALWILVTALFLPLNGGLALVHDSPLYDVYRIALASVTLLFFTGFWSRGGQTLGMRAWRFKVVRDNGRPLRFFRRLEARSRRPGLTGTGRPRLLVGLIRSAKPGLA